MRIEFCGPMGIGKTTMAKALAEYYHWTLVEEASVDHPFLPAFYKNPQKYGFEKDAYFALAYINNAKKYIGNNTIFDAGHLGGQSYSALTSKTAAEKASIDALYAQADTLKPDLIIYLDYPVEKIIERIASRSREMEKDIPESYIRGLKNEMEKRLPKANAPVLRLNMEEFDVVNRPDDVRKVAKLINDKLRQNQRPAPRSAQFRN